MKTSRVLGGAAIGLACLLGGTTRMAIAGENCFFKGTMYSHGAASCQSGSQYRCDEGEWTASGMPCKSDTVAVSRTCQHDNIVFSSGAASCQAGTQFRCEDGEWTSLGTTCKVLSSNTVRPTTGGDTCMYQGATVASSSTICKDSSTFLCNNGEWVNLGTLCR